MANSEPRIAHRVPLRPPRRLRYNARTETSPTHPKAQIVEILLPERPTALRPYAGYTTCLEEGLWIRLCYKKKKKEEAHEALRSYNKDVAYIGPEGVVLDDENIFGGGLDVTAALELFLERVTNEGSTGHVKLREETLREIKEMLAQMRATRAANPLLNYGMYHAACVITHAFVEDEVAPDGGVCCMNSRMIVGM
ncbi:hypothetical protein N7463_009723 [Penicillium fimorum]|uniref:Uncharacterized protein n=1 Tax=Penicillium fimorum TaxID=1882269 RepID=A0A9W9XII7_9EURO|nr:hypothetical protein N7463_009723 [Penicillium fimorum]